jgi:hypothetical protein
MSSTTEQIGSAIKTFAKIGMAILLQILLFSFIGIVLNMILTLVMIPEIGELGRSDMWEYSNERYSQWDKFKEYLPLILLLLCFLLIFPVVYIFLGKKQGVKAGVSKFIHEKGNSMIGFIVIKFTDKMANDPKWNESVKQNGIVKTAQNKFPGFIKTLNGLPWLLKRPLKVVFETIDFATAIEDAVKTRPDAPINSPETQTHITETVANKLKTKFPPPKGKLLLIMVIVNVVICVVIKIVV